MTAPTSSPSDDAHSPRTWVRTGPHTASLTVQNPGAMTLTGTNTYVIGLLGEQWPPQRWDGTRRDGAPGGAVANVVVVDPGPEDEEHLRALAEVGEVQLILLTHRHEDHSGGARLLHELTGAPVRAWDEALCIGAPPLHDGEVITVSEVETTVLHTPGHTSDSVCLVVGADSSILTGDMILGSGTTMLDYPDGDLEDYLDSMRELIQLGDLIVLPAHGSFGAELESVAEHLLEHRLDRVHELRHLIQATDDDLAPSATGLTAQVYGDVPEEVRPSALKTLKAQLAYLAELGDIAGFSE